MRFKDWKIRTRVGVGFAAVFIIAALTIFLSMMSAMSVRLNFIHLNQYPTERYILLNQFDASFKEARRIVTTKSFFAGDYAVLNSLWADGLVLLDEANRLIETYRENLRNDYRIASEKQNRLIEMSYYVEQQRQRHFDEVAAVMYATAMENAHDVREQIAAVFGHSGYVNNLVRGHLDYMMFTARYTARSMQEDTLNTAYTTRHFLLGLIAVAAITGIIVTLVVTSAVTKPIIKIVTAAKEISSGNMSVNLPEASKGEIGELSQSFGGVVDVIKGIMDDVSRLSHEVNIKGDIEYRISAYKYQGAYKEVVDSLNDFTDSFVADVLSVLTALGSVNKGDFNLKIKKLPGKKVILNETIDTLMANLQAVSAEVGAMIEAAAVKGDLQFSIDAKKYEGDWREIMLGLNRVAAAVDAPLKMIRMGMAEMNKGNFDLKKIDAILTNAGHDPNPDSYNGAFKDIVRTFDEVITVTASYIDEISNDLKAIAAGDLTTEITRDFLGSYGAIKDSLNYISSSLHKTMTEIQGASAQVLSGARQISDSAAVLASGASEQAGSVEELNKAIDQISQQTRQNAESAATANELSGKSAQNASKGNFAMGQMVEAMAQIKESSGNISKIVSTIQDIAFQTNLLALNASVEAARAGEHGKGFSVVAEEVRTLAGRSQNAATETTELISDSINRVESGSNIAQSTAESLNAIVLSADEVLTIISSISAASKEQAGAIANISGGLEQISKVVQNNSSVSEEAAAASQELSSQAQMLGQLVSFFKL
ncbi:MAG: methyl-accepting chemotaxis protein [Defluviitaleaceae bacterium]|nr:methyl-accepting chemotaxis protein [Defluviitaleaceae bacterium]